MMTRSVKPPRVVMVRPKSAGSIRRTPRASGSAVGVIGDPIAPDPPAPAPMPHEPVRPVSNSVKRPSSANSARRRSDVPISPVVVLPRFSLNGESHDSFTWTQEAANLLENHTNNIYYAVVARKDAEDTAKQLARRIARFRSQEDRVLQDMQTMRTQLESTLATPEQKPSSAVFSPVPPTNRLLAPSHRIHLQSRSSQALNVNASQSTKHSPAISKDKRRLRVPHSREQLEFLAKQKQTLEARNHEAARQEKEKRKVL